MTILDLNTLLLIGALCGGIYTTDPVSHGVYSQWDELNIRLEQSCIEMRRRDKYIQGIMKLPSR